MASFEQWKGWKKFVETAAPTKVVVTNDIENEAKIIDKLVVSARNGQWQQVWQILGSVEHPIRDRIFNSIPENRRWGILHQAIYWNNEEILRYLLKYEACDSEMKAKACTSECGETTRMTAKEIAVAYKHENMAAILSKHTNRIFDQDIPTFESYENYTENMGLGLISVTLAAYKNTFHPKPIDPTKPVTAILHDIFQDILTSDDRRKSIQEKVSDSVYVVCEDHSEIVKSSNSRENFFMNIIKTYTLEDNFMYTYLNMAFRRQRQKNYRPTGDDLALGPYAVMYQMLLLYWPELGRENRKTYRRMLLSAQDADKYQVGTKLVWQSVVSSSVKIESALPFPTCGPPGDQPVVFTIDNSTNSSWQPRNIEEYAMYMEHERTYPAGAKFQVTGRSMKGTDIYVNLKLLSN